MSADRFISPCALPEGEQRELLTVLMEECIEVIRECTDVAARASKALRFGLDEIQPGQLNTNIERLSTEVGDLVAALCRCVEKGVISEAVLTEAFDAKHVKLDRFLQARPRGNLE